MVRFNQASEDEGVLRDALAQAEQAIANPPLPTSTSETKETYYDFTVSALVNAALELYRFQGEPHTVIKIFRQAANQAVYLYTNRARPKPQDCRSLWDYIRHMDVAVCFCGVLYTKFLSSLESWKYHHPSGQLLEATADFVDLLKVYLSSKQVDQTVASRIALKLEGPQASEFDKQYIAPQLGALRAIALRDANGVSGNLKRLLDFHTRESHAGQFRLLPDAYICLPALRLVRLAVQSGLGCSIFSPYLPLQLLTPEVSEDDID